MYGYRVKEVKFPLPEFVEAGTIAHWFDEPEPQLRRPQLVDAGVAPKGACMPFPDTHHGPTIQAGTKKRMAASLTRGDKNTLRRLLAFVQAYVQFWTPMDPVTSFDLEEWLAGLDKPESYKQAIRDAEDISWDQVDSRLVSEFCSFIKQEFYPSYKAPRTIQGPSLSVKKLLGPLMHKFERWVIDNLSDYLVKDVAVRDRPAHVVRVFEGIPFRKRGASDFESFEQTWGIGQMEALEFPLFERAFCRLNEFVFIMRILRMIECEFVTLKFRGRCSVVLRGRRKSGVHWTSISNGGGNIFIHLFLGFDLDLGKLIGVFEGDDGLFCYASGKFPTPDDYEKLGFKVKLELHEDAAQASFCGVVFDESDCVPITDPINALMKVGWISGRYGRARNSKLHSLLRAKAYSMIHQYRDCPILHECAQWLLKCTRSLDSRWVVQSSDTDAWQAAILKSALQDDSIWDEPKRTLATRMIMEEKFGVDVATQLRLEKWFVDQVDLQPIPLESDNEDWKHFYDVYVQTPSSPVFDQLPLICEQTYEYENWKVCEGDKQFSIDIDHNSRWARLHKF